jgi:hypothetical protein
MLSDLRRRGRARAAPLLASAGRPVQPSTRGGLSDGGGVASFGNDGLVIRIQVSDQQAYGRRACPQWAAAVVTSDSSRAKLSNCRTASSPSAA